MVEQTKTLTKEDWNREAFIDPLAQNPDVGADLNLIANHETELGGIVEQMWKDMVNETKLLEGTIIPEREELTNPIGDLPLTLTLEVEKRIEELSLETECKE